MNTAQNHGPYGQAQYTGVFVSPSPVTSPRVCEIPIETERRPAGSETLAKNPSWLAERTVTRPVPVSPVPTPPKDSLGTALRPPTYSVVASPSPPAPSTAHPGGLPTWSSAPPSWGAAHPFVPTSLSMPTPTAYPAPYYPMGSFPPPPPMTAPTMSHAQEELLGVSSRRLAREMMASGRPPKEKKFSGDDRTVDFESYMSKFERVTAGDHITDQMKFMELGHWFVGSAAEIVSMYELEPDPTVALNQAKDHLRSYFGRQYRSASMMIDDLLSGKKILEGEPKKLQQFVLTLERIYMKAVQTGRASTFNTPDLISLILRKKLEYLTKKWSTERVKAEERADELGMECHVDMDFDHFLNFLKRQLRISMTNQYVTGNPVDPKPSPSEPKTPNPSNASKRSSGMIHTINSSSDDLAPNPPLSRRGGGAANTGSLATPTPRVGFPPLLRANPSKDEDPHVLEEASKRDWRCRFCENTNSHAIQECETFKTGNPTSRWNMIKATGVCTKCFKRGHIGKDCPSDVSCAVCGGRHNTLMHHDQPLGPNPPSE